MMEKLIKLNNFLHLNYNSWFEPLICPDTELNLIGCPKLKRSKGNPWTKSSVTYVATAKPPQLSIYRPHHMAARTRHHRTAPPKPPLLPPVLLPIFNGTVLQICSLHSSLLLFFFSSQLQTSVSFFPSPLVLTFSHFLALSWPPHSHTQDPRHGWTKHEDGVTVSQVHESSRGRTQSLSSSTRP